MAGGSARDRDAPEGGAPPGDALADVLGELLRGRPSAQDLTDVLWMARVAGLAAPEPAAPAGPAGPEPPAGPPAAPSAPGGGPPSPGAAPPAPPGAGPAPRAPAVPGPRVGLHHPAEAGREGAGAAESGAVGHTVRVGRPAALAGTLDLARALRPLRQSVAAPGPAVLDEEATAQATAEAGRLIPVWRPALERRFSVDLVIDTGATMAVWHRLAAELCTLLERHGAFADVRCWSLGTDGPRPRLTRFRRGPGAGLPAPALPWPGPLEDPTGRAILLVLTDGVGPAWYGDALPDFLARVTARRPAAALQVLPRRLWHRTALRTAPVELRVQDPASPVAEVRTTAALPHAGAARWLPVLEVDGAWLGPWAELLAGRAGGWSPMLAAPVGGVPRPRRTPASAPPPDPAARVARFRAGCSPAAFRLACHLAAAPLSLPVMRLVLRADSQLAATEAERSAAGHAARRMADLLLAGVGEDRPGPGN